MRRVEFRFLQVLPSPLTDDKISVGLVHWDGQTVRHAFSDARVAATVPVPMRAIQTTFNSRVRTARKRAGEKTQTSSLRLDDLLTVRDGLTASLVWAPVRVSRTSNTEAHFEELAKLAGLRDSKALPNTVQSLKSSVSAMAKKLKYELGDEVIETERRVKHRKEFTSPVSWKNGVWHHTIIQSVSPRDQELNQFAIKLAGLVNLAIPPSEHAVVIAAVPNADVADMVRDEVRALSDLRALELIPSVGTPRRTAEALERRIRSDVAHAR